MELQNIELWEIAPFFDSLGREKELVMMNSDSVMASSFIAGIRVDNELAGVTGIRIIYKFIPDLFIVVKEKYQGLHLSNNLMEKNLNFARENYDFLTLSTYLRKDYEAALHLYEKYGFKYLRRQGEHYWMHISFNRKGEIACKLLPLLISPVLPFLSHLFSGRIFRAGYKKLFQRRTKKILT